MELSLKLIENIAALFIMMGIGYYLVKSKICKVEDSKVVSSILLYVAAPCAIIKSFQIELSSDKIKGLLLCVFFAIIMHIIYILLAEILTKKFRFSAIEKANIIYSNSANLIIPLVTTVLGSEMTFYTCGYMMVQTVLLWTHCKFLISEEKTFNFKKIFFSFNILSICVGLILFIFQIKLPSIMNTTIVNMSNLLGPLSMLVIGMLLAKINLLDIFKEKRHYLVVFFRLIIYPSIALLVIALTGIYKWVPNGKEILLVSLLATAAPSASTVTQFGQLYDNQPTESSSINALSVIFCIITMPLMVMIYSYMI